MNQEDPKTDLRSVGVIGAGTMGIGVAHDLVLHGLSAVRVDVSEAAKVKVSEVQERLRFTTRLADVAGWDFII
ncbi:3-hydroxyacyl-CoA dehydrogenase NAD-binding domain-containing protein [Corallococcus sp. 4LFB]|uniref:3-hydroxyacyl-CoA dehydrogenase NAD-binding domain-containing protein n=1 Tax=Corallococcus sp. 4LFB TaxID=3383249 RepID=UPI0039769611